jgi:hypothetical protein
MALAVELIPGTPDIAQRWKLGDEVIRKSVNHPITQSPNSNQGGTAKPFALEVNGLFSFSIADFRFSI